jgi:outer membrane protein, multidrug efflux system
MLRREGAKGRAGSAASSLLSGGSRWSVLGQAVMLGRALVLAMLALIGLASLVEGQEQMSGRSMVASHGSVADGLSFWDVLRDTTLVRLIDEALEANPSLAAAEARIRGARAERFQAALDLAPTVTAVGGYTRQRISGASFPGLSGPLPDQDVWEAGIRMTWDLDVFGRTRNALAGQAGLLDAAQADVQDTRVLLSVEVATSYFRLRGFQDRLAVARRNADNQRRTLAVTEERLDAGRGTALDTERARAQLASTLSAIPVLEGLATIEQNRLATLLGREPGTVVGERAEGADPVPLPERLVLPDTHQAVLQRPDVLGAEHRLDASERFVGAAKASYLPRISVQGAAGYTANAFDALGNTGTPRYAIGPVVSWPLLDLARVKSGVDRARAGAAVAQANYEGAVLGARAEVESSRVEYERARERLRHLQDAAEASARASELARLRYEEGAGDFLEVLDAERRLLEAEDRLSEGRTAATSALVGVYRALGVGLTGEPRR